MLINDKPRTVRLTFNSILSGHVTINLELANKMEEGVKAIWLADTVTKWTKGEMPPADVLTAFDYILSGRIRGWIQGKIKDE